MRRRPAGIGAFRQLDQLQFAFRARQDVQETRRDRNGLDDAGALLAAGLRKVVRVVIDLAHLAVLPEPSGGDGSPARRTLAASHIKVIPGRTALPLDFR